METASKCPVGDVVKQKAFPSCLGFPQVFHPPQPPPALTHHLHLTRYGSLHGKEKIYLYFRSKNQGINGLRHQYIDPFFTHPCQVIESIAITSGCLNSFATVL